MAKTLFNYLALALLFCIPFNSKATSDPTGVPYDLVTCTAPPPATLSATIVGPTSIKVDWVPNSPGDLVTIEGMRQDNPASPWVIFSTILHQGGTTLTYTALPAGIYKFRISTECGDGSHGPSAETKPVGLILDLVTNARIPVSPQTKTPCITAINCTENNFVGFKIEKSGQNPTSAIYEYSYSATGAKPAIKRPAGTDIYAMHPVTFAYPDPDVNLESEYFIIKRDLGGGSFYNIGRMAAHKTNNSGEVIFCIENDANNQWDWSYSMTPVTASSTNGAAPSGGGDRDEQAENTFTENKAFLTVQNPADVTLNIFLGSMEYSEVRFQLFNSLGTTVLNEQSSAKTEQITTDVSMLPAGVYYLHVRIDDNKPVVKKIVIQ